MSDYQNTKITGRKDSPIGSNGSAGAGDATPKIKNVKLVDDEYLEIEFFKEETDGTTSTQGYKNPKRPVHPDMRKALDDLRIHWALQTTFLEAGKKKSVEAFSEQELADFTVTGISMGNIADQAKVIITGYKSRKDERAVLVNAPFQFFDVKEDQPDYGWNRFLDNLQQRVQKVLVEARLYIGGKRDKMVVQAEMGLPEENE